MSFFNLGEFAEAYETDPEVRVAKMTSRALKEKYGWDYPWQYIWAQNRHETGGFDNIESELAQKHHNYAGVKIYSDDEPAVPGPTPEDDGIPYRHYDSDREFANEQAKNLNGYWPYGLFFANSAADAANALVDGGYVTPTKQHPTPELARANYVNDVSQLAEEAPGKYQFSIDDFLRSGR